MPILNSLLNPLKHCEVVTSHLLKLLGVKFTRTYLQEKLQDHPNYPSLIAIADVLGIFYNVASLPLKIESNKLFNGVGGIPTPFIAHLKAGTSGQIFTVVSDVTIESLTHFNPDTKQTEVLSRVEFDQRFLGTILVVEADDSAKEKDFDVHAKNERRQNRLLNINVFALPILIVGIWLLELTTNQYNTIIPSIYLSLLMFIGSIISILLLWHELDAYNPTLRQICQASRKVNCAAVLESKASKLFGVSWSSIGFMYFSGSLFALLSSGFSNHSVTLLLSLLNVISLPYIIFSVYYQWKVAKQWCLLCLFVQCVLLLEFITAFNGGVYEHFSLNDVSVSSIITVLTSFGFVFNSTFLLIPALKKAKDSRTKSIQVQRLKHDTNIFKALLAKQRSIPVPPSDLGLSFGNLNGNQKLLKVCNPFCGPCANAHPIIEAIVEHNDQLNVQIIFTATENDNDVRKQIVSHFLAIDSLQDKSLIRRALNDWYLSNEKDYKSFAVKHPEINGEIHQQNDKIIKMKKWCESIGVQSTPTYFICLDSSATKPELFQLPEIYTASDLQYFLIPEISSTD